MLISLVILLSVVNAAWILNYNKTITANVIGEERTFTFSHEFEDVLDLDTSNGPNSTITIWEIENLEEDLNTTFDISTHKFNLTSEEICSDYKKDCRVIVTHIYNNGTGEVRDLLSYIEGSSVTGDANLILFEDISNVIEYRIECAENSCSQEIVSEITIEEFTNYFPED